MGITKKEIIIAPELSKKEIILGKIKENKLLIIGLILSILAGGYKMGYNDVELTSNRKNESLDLGNQGLFKPGDIMISEKFKVIPKSEPNINAIIKDIIDSHKISEPKTSIESQPNVRSQPSVKAQIKEHIVEKNISFAKFCKENNVNLIEWARILVGKNLEKKCGPTVLIPLIAYLSSEQDIRLNIEKLNQSSNRYGKNFTFFTRELVKEGLAKEVSYEQILKGNISPGTIITYLGLDDNNHGHVEIIISDNNGKIVPFYGKIGNTIRVSRKASPALKSLESGNFQEFLKSTRGLSSAVCVKKGIDLNQFISIFKSIFDGLSEVENLDISLKEIAEINFNKNLKPELFAYNNVDTKDKGTKIY